MPDRAPDNAEETDPGRDGRRRSEPEDRGDGPASRYSEPEDRGDDRLLAIGEVASVSGLAVSAVRYYHELGLIDATRVNGNRFFRPDTLWRVDFIKRSRAAGFSLDEIGRILDDTEGGWQVLVDDKLAELIDQRSRLDELIDALTEIRACGCSAVAACAEAMATHRSDLSTARAAADTASA